MSGPHVVVGAGSYAPKDPILSVQIQVSSTVRSLADMLAGNAGVLDNAQEVWIQPEGPIRVAFADDASANTGVTVNPAVDPIQIWPASMAKAATYWASGNTLVNVEIFGKST
jgi:hypothetical protein